MQAAVLDGNGTISIEHVDLAAPGPGEVRVEIAAAGVCHSDLHVTTGAWDVPAPVVLGHEGSGVVTAVGPGVDDLEPGDH
nr:alcohol dehydrogenase catalytic domain-containing protein [Streptomyces sp. DSM 41633]